MSSRLPKRKAIIFDRDGTIITDKRYLNDPEAIEYLPGIFEALQKFRDAGYLFFVATNQSGIPRGIVELDCLHEIHRRIKAEFARQGVDLLEFYYAPYPTDSGHVMRKPNPGMLLQCAQEYNIDLKNSWMIGDRMVDVEAGHRAGARSILVGKRENPDEFDFPPPENKFLNVIDAVDFILNFSSEISP